MFCPECGKEIDDSSVFCTYCGSPVPTAAPDTTTTGMPQQGGHNTLVSPTGAVGMASSLGAKGGRGAGGNKALPVALALACVALAVIGVILVPRVLNTPKTGQPDQPAVIKPDTTATKREETALVSSEDPTKLTVEVNDVESEDYPEVRVNLSFKDPDGSPVEDLERASIAVTETDDAGKTHAGAVSSLSSKGGGYYELTYTSGSGDSDSVKFEVTCEQGRMYKGSASGSYDVPVASTPEPTPAPQPAPQPSTPTPSVTTGYILPDSNSRYYSASELSWMSKSQLELARNEIYARHGRGFNTDYIQEYFYGCSWYTRIYSPEEFDAMLAANPGIFNDYEYANVALLWDLE